MTEKITEKMTGQLTEQQTFVLQQPIQQGSASITEFTIAPPKAKHFRGISTEMSMSDMLDLAGKLSGQPPTVIDELSVIDMQRLMTEINRFLGHSPATGKTL